MTPGKTFRSFATKTDSFRGFLICAWVSIGKIKGLIFAELVVVQLQPNCANKRFITGLEELFSGG